MRKSVLLLLAAFAAIASPAAAQEVKAPRITPATVRVTVPGDTEIEAVGEGIVTLRSQNKLAFYNIDTQLLFGDFAYMPVGGYSDKTYFSGGACTVKTEETPAGSYSKVTTFHILYPDGTSKKLPPDTYRKVGLFRDGVAPAKKGTGAFSVVPAFVGKDGKFVLGAVTEGKTVYGDPEVRGLSDGMRAVFADGWGFVDASGKVVIAPKYKKVSDFSEGMALVATQSGKYGIIDRSGKTVVAEGIDAGWMEPRGFHDGWAYLPAKKCFIDTKGNPSPEAEAVTDFCNGHALVKNGWDGIGIIDTSFGEPKKLDFDSNLAPWKDAPARFIDGYFLLVSYNGAYLVDSRGDLKLKTAGTCGGTGLWEGPWVTLWLDRTDGISYDHEAYAVCNADGEIVVIFDRKGMFTDVPVPVIRKPTEPTRDDKYTGDPPRTKPGGDDTPTDINGNPVSIVKEIKVIFDEPFEGPRNADVYANVEIGKPVHPGDTLKIAVLPAGERDWVKVPVATTRNGGREKAAPMIPAGPGAFVSVLKAGNTFVEVHIGQEKEPSIDRKWLLEGHRDFTFNGDEVDNLDADVRIVTDPAGIKGTLFGDDTKGLFLVDFDQRKKFTVYWNGKKDKPIPDFASFFWGPAKIEGFREENGTKYIYMNGGITAVGNWMDYGKDDLGGLMVTLLTSLSNMNKEVTGGDPTYVVLTRPHRYRLSYTDLPDGGMTLGLMERFSPEYGWVPTDDKRLIRKTHKNIGFATLHDRSEGPMEPDILKGITLKWVQKDWTLPSFYPGNNWFTDDEHYRHTVEAFNRMYASAGKGERPYSRAECAAFLKKMLPKWGLKKIQ